MTKYDKQALKPQILEKLTEGMSLLSISKLEGFPSVGTCFTWMNEDPESIEKYERARQLQAELYAEEIISISDDLSGDHNRDRLRVDARKWYASKCAPKRFGDKVEQTTKLEATDGLSLLLEAVSGKTRSITPTDG